MTPLQTLVLSKNSELVQIFLDYSNNLDINKCSTNWGDSSLTAFQLACKDQDLKIVTIFLKHKKFQKILDINSYNSDGNCPIFYGLENKNDEFVKLLLKSGKLKKVTKYDKHEPVIEIALFCIKSDWITMLNFLISDFFDIIKKNLQILAEATIKQYKPKILDHLLKTIKDFQENHLQPAFFMAVEKSYASIVEILMNSNLIDINKKNNYGANALHMAIRKTSESEIDTNKHKILELILKNNKLNINIQTVTGFTALHIAIENSQYKLANSILSFEMIDPNIARIDGFTPLHLAIYKENIDFVKLLLSNKKININIFNNREELTPLALACEIGNFEIVKILTKDTRINLNYTQNINIHFLTILIKNYNSIQPTVMGQDNSSAIQRKAKFFEIINFFLSSECEGKIKFDIFDQLGHNIFLKMAESLQNSPLIPLLNKRLSLEAKPENHGNRT